MTQVAVSAPPHDCSSGSKAKRTTFLSSGRGGSGNIRRQKVAMDRNRPDETCTRGRAADKRPEGSGSPPERRVVDARNLTSSGRGGSGNIQPSASDLEDHPLTASILSQHNAMQAQYEQWVRKAHAESKVVRSSGRGGSGNITDARQRSRSQGPSTAPKRRFFTTKGREKRTKCSDGIAQAQDREDGSVVDKRMSHSTYSSGGSSALETQYGQQSPVSDVMTSRHSVTSNLSSCEDPITGRPGKRQNFSIRWSRQASSTSSVASPESPCSPAASMYSPSLRPRSLTSSSKVYPHTPVILEDQEYVSFLDL